MNREIIAKIPDVASFEWGGDDETIYYTKMDSAHRPYQVWENNLDNSESDKLIFEEGDELFWVGISKSRDRQLLFISSSSKETSEISYIDINLKTNNLIKIKPRKQGTLYSVSKRTVSYTHLTLPTKRIV